ncbi:hypothetical protein KO02_13440 [Sphingobacterium sp. ML3W]|uniref:GAP1-N1 domain-containing protein n=1 Tax=Sphingobacterium sp. ML3W TaxID=1538644 RepID=UPI0004F80E30|nr:effector-associated domain EAD1-containing protein [Sphingobacterium sp. ML3W]AIM37578.1 hypothetical protein KO02_13440 [Sphingobacterium sp. ML3W]
MRVEVHQSICGEVNRAWGLLKTTLPDAKVAKNIAFRADLQDQTSGVMWSPAIRGFAEGSNFVIMKTFEDTSEEVRRGRKFSHVLIVSLKEIVEISDLEPIFGLLYSEIDKFSPLNPIYLDILCTENKSKSIVIEENGRIAKLLNGYINIQKYRNNIVWIGQDDFKTAINELWRRLTNIEKQNFQFGVVFNSDLNQREGINLFAAPDSVYSKFIKSNFFIVGKKDSHTPTDLLEKFIVGDMAIIKRVRDFENSIGAAEFSREDIKMISVGIETFEQVDSVSDLKKLNTLSHIVAKYSPSNKKGSQFKKRLLDRIIESTKDVGLGELNVLRNFKINSFEKSEELLSESLRNRMKKDIFSNNATLDILIFFFTSKRNENLIWWDLVIDQELRSYLENFTLLKVSVVFNWIVKFPMVIKYIDYELDKSENAQRLFIKKVTKSLKSEALESLLYLSKLNNWLKLYAILLSLKYSIKDALSLLLEIDKDHSHYAAIEIIFKKTKDHDVISIALENGDPRLIIISSRLCHINPSLLNDIDVANERWQNIWDGAINMGNQVETGFDNPEQTINKVYDVIINGGKIIESLLNKISSSRFANILYYENRSSLWSCLPDEIMDKFLMKTSSELLEKLSKNSTTPIPDDRVLLQHISNTGITDFLYYNRSNISSVVPLFERFPKLSDNYLKDYLMNYSGKLNQVESISLGRMVLKKRFTNSAYYINLRADKSNNWKYALMECHQLLDFKTKAGIAFSNIFSKDKKVNIASDEWWNALEDIVTEIYSNGVSLTTVWTKAGGKEADLIMNITPADLWSHLLKKLRRDQYKSIKTYKLLETIRKDYGDNGKFKTIYKLRKNYIKT